MQVQPLFLLIPAVVGFFWLVAFVIFTPGNVFFRKLKRFIAVLSFFFLFSYLSSDTDSRLMLHFVLFEQVCALAIVPSFLSLVEEYGNKIRSSLLFRLCCVIPMIHIVIGIESVFVAGFEKSVDIYLESMSFNGPMFPFLENNGQMVFYASYTYMFRTFVLINFLLFAINVMSCAINGKCRVSDVFGFLFRGGKTYLSPVIFSQTLLILLIVVPVLVLGKECYAGRIVITAMACLLLGYLIAVISLVGAGGPSDGMSSLKIIIGSIKDRKAKN